MVTVKKEGIVLKKTDLPFENEGVLNPAVIREGNNVHMFYRAVHKGNYSSIGYCRFDGPLNLAERNDTALLSPELEYESHGIEDPRIVNIDGLYYLSFTAYDGINAMGALATSKDLKQFDRKGMIVPQFTFNEFKSLAQRSGPLNKKYKRYANKVLSTKNHKVLLWDKNVIFFPRRINGKLFFMHRIRPDIQIASVTNLEDLTKEYWENYLLNFQANIALTPKFEHEISYIGGGCPPIETPQGWLLIYHGVHDATHGYVYSACAALMDLENPLKEIARLPYALFTPELEWELKGEVNNVVFPTGTALFDDTLYIYYGAADERIACASLSLKELLSELTINS
ncbi:MAG: pesticidal protein Cry7Aa [Bacteroidota bacterium]